MLPAILGQVQPRDTAQLDTQRLQENGKQIGHQDDEQMAEVSGGAGLDIGGVVAGVNIGHGNEETGTHELEILPQGDDDLV